MSIRAKHNVNSTYDALLNDTANLQVSGDHHLLPVPSRYRILNRSNARSLMRHINMGSLRLRVLGYITDGFTTIVNAQWTIIISLFCLLYISSWLLFSGIWALVAWVDGHFNNTCLENVYDFNSAFLFSIETQVTIGYGSKYIQNTCSWGIFFLIIQCLVGLIIDSFTLGLFFAKLIRPRNRRKTMVFSNKAVICRRDGSTFLEFRVCDLRRSQIVECHVRITLYWNRLVDPSAVTDEKRYSFEQYDLECGYETGRDRIFLLTPAIVSHKIDEKSPLYGLTPLELCSQDLEVLVIVEGIVEATGLTVQALWSYTNEEIVVDHRFLSMVQRNRGQWEIDFAKVDAMEPCQ